MPEHREAMERCLQRWVRPALIDSGSYAPPPGARVKLDAMENPYPNDAGDWDTGQPVLLNRYPDAAGQRLRRSLKTIWSVPDELALVPGNGSDELILYLCLLMAGDDRRVLVPEPSFVMYRYLSTLTGFHCVGVPLRPDWQLDMPAMLQAIRHNKPAIVWLAWPNNPTGALYPRPDITALAMEAPGLLVVDEAYHPYSRLSLLDQPPLPDNVIILRTVSKLGLAGLRIGAAIGWPSWLTQLEKIRLPYNIGSLPQAAASMLPARYAGLLAQTDRIREQRQALRRRLEKIPGVTVWPSAANFLLITLDRGDADAACRRLLDQGISIKNLHGSHPALDQCLRITIGLPEENDAVWQSLCGIVP